MGITERMSPQEAKGSQHVSQIALCVIAITCNSERQLRLAWEFPCRRTAAPFRKRRFRPSEAALDTRGRAHCAEHQRLWRKRELLAAIMNRKRPEINQSTELLSEVATR
jgi:hypothetical protein